jgi:hypothetical protein
VLNLFWLAVRPKDFETIAELELSLEEQEMNKEST